MTGRSDRPDEETPPTQIAALPVAERQALAALAVVGSASLSADELAELAEVEDVTPLIADLEQRGLIKHEQKQRYSMLGHVGEEIRHADEALSTGERLLKYMTTLAKGGQLTPERMLDDAEAILGLTEWAAEMRQWERLLELVKTLQACFGIAHRVEEWLTLLNRGRAAAHALGDRRSEVWMLQQLAVASASAGDRGAAQKYLSEADKLQPWHQLIPRPGGGGSARIALWTLGLAFAAMAGGATGYAIGNNTTQVSARAASHGKTVTTFKTVTLPAKTVLSTTTVTTTVTTTTTTPATGRPLPLQTTETG